MCCSCWLLLLVSFAGCTSGLQVHDNTYDALGGQVIKVNKDFTYLGDCDPRVMTTSNEGRAKVDGSIKTRGDVFVKADGKKPIEFAIMQRLKILKTGWSWSPGGGVPTKFHGVNYKAAQFDLSKGVGSTVMSYVRFAEQKGYVIPDAEYLMVELVRNVGNQNRVFIYYGIAKSEIPQDVLDDEEKLDEFTTKRFNDALTVL